MDPNLNLMRKRRPSLSDCGVRPLDRKVHHYLISSYLMWPLIFCLGLFQTKPLVVVSIVVSFVVLGMLFYNLLVSMCLMSHDPKKRLRTGQWIFYVSLGILTLRLFGLV